MFWRRSAPPAPLMPPHGCSALIRETARTLRGDVPSSTRRLLNRDTRDHAEIAAEGRTRRLS